MPRFSYRAATPSNERRDGTVEAASLDAALADLRRQGLVVIHVGAPSRAAALWEALNRDVSLRPPITAPELAQLSQEWAGLIEAGVSIEDSLSLLIDGARLKTRNVLLQIREAIKSGAALHDALEQHPACFPPTYRALVRAGEAAGTLGGTLRQLADDLSAKRGLAEDLRNAFLYPIFLLITATAGITILLVVVVPNLEELLGARSLDALPFATRVVIATSHTLRDHGLTLSVALALLVFGSAAAARTAAGRAAIDRLLLRVPVAGPLVRAIETGRFLRSLGALISGGVALSRAMPLAVRTVANTAMRTSLVNAHERILEGAALGDAVAASGVLPADAIGLMRVGERTGRLDAALGRAAALFEGRATRRLKALTTMLTPVLTIGFGLIAGVIVYAMLSTILSINDLAAQ